MRDPREWMVALVEILMVSGILTQTLAAAILSTAGRKEFDSPPGLFLLTSVDALLLIGLIALLQWRRGSWTRPFGLRPPSLSAEISSGILLGLAFFAVLVLGSDWFFSRFLPDLHTRRNPILSLLQSPADLALLLGCGVVGGGIREELQRAFIILRLETLSRFPTAGPGSEERAGASPETRTFPWVLWTGLALWSVLFGLGHHLQGPDAVLTTATAGFLLGCIFLWRRSLLPPVICHSLSNSLTIFAVYYFPALNS